MQGNERSVDRGYSRAWYRYKEFSKAFASHPQCQSRWTWGNVISPQVGSRCWYVYPSIQILFLFHNTQSGKYNLLLLLNIITKEFTIISYIQVGDLWFTYTWTTRVLQYVFFCEWVDMDLIHTTRYRDTMPDEMKALKLWASQFEFVEMLNTKTMFGFQS